MVKSLQRLIFRNGGSTSIVLVRTVIYQRDKFVQCYEASSFCYMYLASKVARCNISSNTKETNMHAIASQWLTDHSKYVLPLFQNKFLNFVQTLVQSCTTTKVDTYFGTEAAKEKKTIHAVPSPWTVNPNQASICWQRSSFLRNEVCNLLTIGSFCAVSPKSRLASMWQRNWRSMIRIRLLGLVDET